MRTRWRLLRPPGASSRQPRSQERWSTATTGLRNTLPTAFHPSSPQKPRPEMRLRLRPCRICSAAPMPSCGGRSFKSQAASWMGIIPGPSSRCELNGPSSHRELLPSAANYSWLILTPAFYSVARVSVTTPQIFGMPQRLARRSCSSFRLSQKIRKCGSSSWIGRSTSDTRLSTEHWS